ncbi:G protein-coupled glucose receptor regulating Gpa2-domain-containing protein, partial [Xylaria telfairii]
MIMLLIQSDMAKALWLLISPLFYFITGKPFNSNWAFCQVSGFFLTVTIEASDIAVLLIAIHTALFVVKRQYPGVAVGLQPYRRIAYTVWAVVPFILAAIVPITGARFADNGPYCYLPIHPDWYSNALAWVPRYIILSFIIVTYTWLYFYVYLRFRRFEEDQRRASILSSYSGDSSSRRRRARRRWRSHSVPTTPSLATHNLLDDSPPSTNIKSEPIKLRQYSVASTVSTLHISEAVCLPTLPAPVVARRRLIAWNLIDFGGDGTGTSELAAARIETVPSSPTTQIFTSFSQDISRITSNINTADTTIQPPELVHAATSGDLSSHNLHHARSNRRKRRFTELGPRPEIARSRKDSVANMITALRQGPPRRPEEDGNSSSPSPSSSVHLSTEVSSGLMRQSRDRMRRQLRLLFVYPAIYTLTWIAPFVAHACRYYDMYPQLDSNDSSSGAAHGLPAGSAGAATTVHHPEPLALRIVTTASLCIGAAVDCGFFSAWERPWRHLRGGFWENLALRLRLHRLFGVGMADDGPGRSRDEQVADERAARVRRQREREEMAAATARASGSSTAASGGGGLETGVPLTAAPGWTGQAGRRREWWDYLDEL